MTALRYIDPQYIDQLTIKRPGEPRLGEVLSLITSEKDLQTSKARYLLLGIPEDIGIRANGGRPGAAKTWAAFLSYFCSLPAATNSPLAQVALLGTIECNDLMEESLTLDWRDKNDQKTFNHLLLTLDKRVDEVIQPLIADGYIPVVIGGGHNNALGLLRASSKALNQGMHCLNIDAHTDLRNDEYRHSGNGFQRAILENDLVQYGIFGLHEHTLSPGIMELIALKNNQINYLALNKWLDTPCEARNDLFKRWAEPIIHDQFGLELDLDVIVNMGSSAQSPDGLSLAEVRTIVRILAGHKNLRYIHLCEGAPELGLYPTQVVKTLGALCLDLLV